MQYRTYVRGGGEKQKKIIDQQQKELQRKEQNMKKRLPRENLRLAVDLAEHCNLNCQCCDHFSPLAKEYYSDIEEYKRDLSRLYEIMGDELSLIALEGGEPLLNPNVNEFIKVTRNQCPKAKIKIITNGILLEKMPDEFWNVCQECNLSLETTVYPIQIDYAGIKRLAESKGVNFIYYNGTQMKRTCHRPLDLEGRQNKYNSFLCCPIANGVCSMLKHGRLYPCTMVPNLDTFNAFYKQKLEVTKKDYIDLYSSCTKEDIYDFLCNPVPACRYCKTGEITWREWNTTKYHIEEWT